MVSMFCCIPWKVKSLLIVFVNHQYMSNTQIVGLVCPLGNNLGEANGVPQSTNVTSAPPSSVSMLPIPSRIALPPLHLFTDSTKSTTTLSSDPSYSTSSSTNTTPTKSPLRYHSSTQFSTPPSSTLHYTNTHQTPPTSNSSNRTRLYQSNVRRSDSFSPGKCPYHILCLAQCTWGPLEGAKPAQKSHSRVVNRD